MTKAAKAYLILSFNELESSGIFCTKENLNVETGPPGLDSKTKVANDTKERACF